MGSPTTSGSICGVGWRFQSFKINDLELMDQNSASWNPLIRWLRQVEALRGASWARSLWRASRMIPLFRRRRRRSPAWPRYFWASLKTC